MLRRISTKLILAVLAAVVLPFVAFAFFINYQMENRLTEDVVRQSLLGLVQDLANQIDRFVDERRQDAAQWAEEPILEFALDNYESVKGLQRLHPNDPDRGPWDAEALERWARTRQIPPVSKVDWDFLISLTREFDSIVELTGVYDVILLVSSDGSLATCNSRLPDGTLFGQEYLGRLFDYDYRQVDWFQHGMLGEATRLDHHESPFRAFVDGDDPARNYHIGFAVPVYKPNTGEVIGVLNTLVNWSHVQDLVATPVVKEYFRGLVPRDKDPTPYAWIWMADGDTIIGHPDTSLYNQSVSDNVGLPELVEAVRTSQSGWDLYPPYEFRGEKKNAAFKRTAPPSKGGFNWVVGLGIDDKDIYATSTALRNMLMGGTTIVLLMAILWTMVIARRTTEPIHELQHHTRRVAEGHLDQEIAIRSRDELGELARDFNQMTRELKRQREQLIKAEKDAAWREMARQIAHDIKNPLTPIQLSLDLVERARRDGNPEYDAILERTLDLIGRQVTNLREIASTFYEFTGGRKPEPQVIDLGELVDDVLRLHDAWAVELGVEVQREGPGGRILADPGKLRRVLGNLVSNALQAMGTGGALRVEVAPEGADRMRVTFQDTGAGIPDEVREHLFEPYFTTKSEGTGLGLAIALRVLEEMGGSIEVRPANGAEGGRGTVAEVLLPRHRGDEA